MDSQKNVWQLIWGAALAAAGVGVFWMLPQRMAQIAQARQVAPFSFEMLFLWFCFSLLGIILVGGGLRKIYNGLRAPRRKD
jgi:cobalamin biosynthesis protein CobD/CbiB